MKERMIYWCFKCDKIHRKNSKPGKAHYQDYIKRTRPEQQFIDELGEKR
jgi:hypothetical protein